jgi:hypothetical protein
VNAIASSRPLERRWALAANPDLVALGGLALVSVILAVLTWGTWGDLGRDTGYDLVAGARVAHGQLPYSDFIYFYGPLAPFLLGLAGWIGGAGLTPMLALGLVVALGIVAAAYGVARTQTGPTGSFLAAAVTSAIAFSPTNLSYVLPHTESAPLALLLALCFVLAAARYAAGAGLRMLVLAGVCAGLVALTRPEFEGAVVFAGLVWLVLRARHGASFKREFALLALPAVAIPAVVYGAFLTQISLHSLLLENLYPRDTLRNGGSAIVRSQAPFTPGSIAHVLGYLVLYAIGAAALFGVAVLAERLPRRVAIALTSLIVVVALAVLVVRPETVRYYLEFVYGWIPAGAVVATAALLFRYRRRGRAWDARDQALLLALAVLAVLAVKSYSGFFFLSERAQPAVYAAPFALAGLARLHLVELARTRRALVAGTLWLAFLAAAAVGLTLKDAHGQSATVSGPGGSIKVTAAEAPAYRGALAAIAANSKPGDPILIAPQLSALYTLADRTDPLRQISLLPGALPTAADERAAIARLEQAGVRVAITDRHRFTEYDQTAFGGSFDRILAGWIRRNFDHTATLRPGGGVDHVLDVWVMRRAS